MTGDLQPGRAATGHAAEGLVAGTPGRLTGAGLATLLLGASLPVIDFYIVNVALPTVDTNLHTSAPTLELVVTGYGITYALLLVLGGRLGDGLGRRRLFLAGMIAFTITSLACGIAPNALTLVIARAAQGAAAAMLAPQVLSTVQATTTGHGRSRAVGLYGAVIGISSVVGQLLGGALLSADIAGTSWRPIFLVNVPIGIAAVLLVRRFVPETRSGNPVGVDRPGTVMLGVSLLTLLVPITEGDSLHWPPWIWLLLGAFPFAVAGFVVVETRAERAGRVPLVPPSIMRLPSVRTGLVLILLFLTGFSGFFFVYAVTLQTHLGFGPLAAGVAFMPLGGGFFAMSALSNRLVARFGSKVVPYGILVQLVGMALLIGAVLLEWPHLDALALVPGPALVGVGNAMTMTTLFRVVLSDVPTDRAGIGSGALATTQQSALALGVATLGTLFTTLAMGGALGPKAAFVLVLGVSVLISVGVAAGGRTLP